MPSDYKEKIQRIMSAITVSGVVTLCLGVVYWLDAPNEIASRVVSLVFGKPVRVVLKKPLGCNVCMTFWATLVTLLAMQPSVAWVAFLWAWAAKYVYYIIEGVDRLIMRLLSLIDRL